MVGNESGYQVGLIFVALVMSPLMFAFFIEDEIRIRIGDIGVSPKRRRRSSSCHLLAINKEDSCKLCVKSKYLSSYGVGFGFLLWYLPEDLNEIASSLHNDVARSKSFGIDERNCLPSASSEATRSLTALQ